VTELSEGAVVARVPSLVDERLQVLARRAPVTVAPHTSLADCLAAIRRAIPCSSSIERVDWPAS
jgi:hypothetical protein